MTAFVASRVIGQFEHTIRDPSALAALMPIRDPAYGSSVLLTFITDAMGFFLFLGLAAFFLSS